MPGHHPSLNQEALTRLRKLVAVMHRGDRKSLPMQELVRLADEAGIGAGVTVDFEASRVLGDPMIVVRMNEPDRPASCLAQLSKREREVAALVADGLANKEIAKALHISLATVKDHVHRILSRSGLSNRAAIASAYRGHPPAR